MITINNDIKYAIEKNFDTFLCTKFNALSARHDTPDMELCLHPRKIEGDYNGLAMKLAQYDDLQHGKSQEYILSTLVKALDAISLTPMEAVAAKQTILDLEKTDHLGPILYLEDPFFSFEGYLNNWHHDPGDPENAKIICSYNVGATDILARRNAIALGDCFYQQKENTEYHTLGIGDFSAHLKGDFGLIHKRCNTSRQPFARLVLIA